MLSSLFRPGTTRRAAFTLAVAIIAIVASAARPTVARAAVAHPPAEGEQPHIHLYPEMEPAPLPTGSAFVATGPNPDEPLMAEEHCGPQDGPMLISIDVTRYAGTTNADGTLLHLPVMIQNGLAKPTARLTLMVWGRYTGGHGCSGSMSINNVLHVTFNGTVLQGAIQGQLQDWAWTEVHVEVPTALIRFSAEPGQLRLPSPSTYGEPPTSSAPLSVENEVLIEFRLNQNCWCVRVGWASLQVRLAHPVVFVPGNGQQRTFFEPQDIGFEWTAVVEAPTASNSFLVQRPGSATSVGLLATNAVSFLQDPSPFGDSVMLGAPKAENTFHQNAHTLQVWTRHIATAYGVDALHYVAHSQGGQTVVDFATYASAAQRLHPFAAFNPPRVLSVTTLGSPHMGSPLADYTVARPSVVHAYEGLTMDEAQRLRCIANFTSMGAATPARRTMTRAYTFRYHVQMANAYPEDVVFAAITADADRLPTDGLITDEIEYAGFPTVDERARHRNFILAPAFNLMYKFVGRAPQFQVCRQPLGPNNDIGNTFRVVWGLPTAEDNDIFVSQRSASGGEQSPISGLRTLASVIGPRSFHCAGAQARDHARLGVMDPMITNVRDWVIEAEEKYGAFR